MQLGHCAEHLGKIVVEPNYVNYVYRKMFPPDHFCTHPGMVEWQ